MSTQIHNPYERCPKLDIVYDVIVAGGGPAGIGAALAAALCAQRDVLPRHLDYHLIQQRLDDMGGRL
jgi:tRNA U34 5-carboxymethylaminomethyl modifying enzyme MnmG/GidA